MCSARQENVELLAKSPLHPPEMHSELSFGKILATFFQPGYLTEIQLMWWMPECEDNFFFFFENHITIN